MSFLHKVALLLLLALVLAATAGARLTASGTLTWQGWDDKVGGWWNGSPDNIRDAHFSVALSAPGDTVTAVTLRPLKTDGTIASAHEWNTIPRDGHWILGIARGGALLNSTDVNICDPVGNTTAHYDLYAEDDKSAATFAKWRVVFRLQNGGDVTIDGALGDTSGGPPPPPSTGVPIPSVPQPTGNEPCVASAGDGGGGAGGGGAGGGGGTALGTLRVSLSKSTALAKKTVKAGVCATVYARYDSAVPAGDSVALERRPSGQRAWAVVKRGGASVSAQACAKKRGAAYFRSTLRQGTKVLVTSNLVTLTWR